MNYSIKDINLQAVEVVLRNKEVLMTIAVENFELKRSELELKLCSVENVNDQLIVISEELKSARSIVEQPVAQEYIKLGLLKDVDAEIDYLKSQHGSSSDEHEKLKLLSVLKSSYGMSREEGLKHIQKLFGRDIESFIEELQLFVMNIWTWKLYYSILLQVRRDLTNQLLTEQDINPLLPDNEDKKIKWLGSQKNLAELFIELQEKGFIEKIDVSVIKKTFTGSNTIEQVLKPAHSQGRLADHKPTYEHVYTSKYSPRFDGIRLLVKGK